MSAVAELTQQPELADTKRVPVESNNAVSLSQYMTAHIYIILYIINFVETDQGPRAIKTMFYTADKKVN